MPATSLTAGEVMNMAASLMNDTARSVYSYTVQLPYLQMAWDELQQEYQLNNLPVTNQTSDLIYVPIGTNQIVPSTMGPCNYPDDLIEIQQIWERLQDSEDPFIPLQQVEFIPHYLDPVTTDALLFWSWQNQIIKFNFAGATTNREVKLDYVGNIFKTLVNENSVLDVINAKNFLGFRTAGLCALYIAENPSRAEALSVDAGLAMGQALGIGVKGKQSITTRKRPFRSTYRSRGIW